MNAKLESVLLVMTLLLLAGLVCPQTAQAQIRSTVQSPSGFHSYLPLNSVNTTEANSNATPTAQPADDITQENQMPLMIVIIVAAFAAYIAVIAVLSSKKIR